MLFESLFNMIYQEYEYLLVTIIDLVTSFEE